MSRDELDPIEVEELVARQRLQWARDRQAVGDEACDWVVFEEVVESLERLAAAHEAAALKVKQDVLKQIEDAIYRVATGRAHTIAFPYTNGNGSHEDGGT